MRLSILGVGLLGGSLGLAAKARIKGCHVAGYSHRTTTLKQAVQLGVIDEMYDTPARAVHGADLVVLCTPVSILAPLLSQIAPALAVNALVTDVGSTKRSVVAAGDHALRGSAAFVGSHPMAGSEKRGVEYARADLFDGATCLITPTTQTPASAIERVRIFWEAIGMSVVALSPEEHDRRVAQISHVPHALAAALVAMQDDASFELAGKGFADMTRIAGGDADLWGDILEDNRDNVSAGLRQLQVQLQTLANRIEAGDSASVRAWLAAAAARRQAHLRPRDGGPALVNQHAKS